MDEWELTYEMYDKVTRKIRNKNKKMYELYNKAGADYKMVTFDYMKKLIRSEQVPTSFFRHLSYTIMERQRFSPRP